MSGRGRRAALPVADQGHARPRPLSHSGLQVTHVNEKGDASRRYDFATLPVSEAMQQDLARLFEARVTRGGRWRAIDTSIEAWYQVKALCVFLSALEHRPGDLSGLGPAVWSQWCLSRPDNQIGIRQVTKLASLLLDHPTLPEKTRALMRRRGPAKPNATEVAYTAEEFTAIKRAAERSVRSALHRIRANLDHLNQWKEGAFTTGTSEWLVGQALETLASTGDVPRWKHAGKSRGPVRLPIARALGGATADHTWKRLFLDDVEAKSLAILLIAAHGWNPTTVFELPVPAHQPSADGHTVFRIELEKRRRSLRHRYESRNLTDWGAASPGRLIAHALELTDPARRLLAAAGTTLDQLLVWRLFAPVRPNGIADLFRSGTFQREHQLRWQRKFGMEVSLRRLRKTAVAQHRRSPSQHDQQTHDAVYVLPDPQTHDRAAPVITSGIAAALDHARGEFAARRGTGSEAGADTVTARCTDHASSPFTPVGAPCRASFLLCLACPNAVVGPAHLPRLAYLHRALDELRSVLPPQIWEQDWRSHLDRLEDLRLHHCTEAEWHDAAGADSPADRQAINQLLDGGYDA